MLSNTWFGRTGFKSTQLFPYKLLRERVKLCLQMFFFLNWINSPSGVYKSHLNCIIHITRTAIVIRLLSDDSTSVRLNRSCWSMEKQLPGMVDVLEFSSLFQLWMCMYTCFQWSELYDWLYTQHTKGKLNFSMSLFVNLWISFCNL